MDVLSAAVADAKTMIDEGKATQAEANAMQMCIRDRGKTPWRAEPTPVEMVGDDLWLAEKFQANSEIAGSLRNSFRASVADDSRR